MSKMKVLAAVVAALGVTATMGEAATCTGVEARVNARTSELQASIIALIQAHKATMISTETVQRQAILSALGVTTKQIAASGNQDAAVRLKAEEAQASAIIAAQNRNAVLDAQERYGDVGFKACEVAEKSAALASAFNAQDERIVSIRNQIVNRPYVSQDGQATASWFSMMDDGEGTSAAVLFDGSSTEAEIAKYIDWLFGPPQTAPSGAAGQVGDVARLQADAQRSVASYLLAKAAASSEDGSVDSALADLTETWTGTDGGADWAAKLATSPLRAVLLDMSRAEAANLVAEVVALDHQLDLELGLASFSLGRTSKVIEEMTDKGAQQ
jgi:hypothetical protein